jgi:hypothetical protein
MIADDDWLNFHYAVMEIKAKLGVSIGKAQSILRQLCGSGEVRSQKQPYTTTVLDEFQGGGPPQKIEPCEWREREIDLMTDDDGCRYIVDVRKGDFGYWLDQQKPAKPKTKATPKLDLAKLAIQALWPHGIPKELMHKQIEAPMADWITVHCKRNNLPRPNISRDTLLRAAGRKK